MNLPRLYPILDTASLAERGVSLATAAAAFLEGGAGILQIRHKMHWSRDVFESARQVARLCREAGVPGGALPSLIVKRTVYRIGPDGVIRFARRGMPSPEEVLEALK